MMLASKMMKYLIGVLIFLIICGCVNAEICSVYNNIPISESSNYSNFISDSKFYDNAISMNVKINFECNTLVFNAKNLTSVNGIQLKNIDTNQIYSTDLYYIYDNVILKISFAENIPQGNYNLYFDCNYDINSSPKISEWLVLTNFNGNNLDKTNNQAVRIWLRRSALGHGKYLMENAENLLRAFKESTGVAYNENKFVKLDFFVVPKSSASKHHRGEFIYVDEKIFVDEENIATSNNEKLFRSIVEIMVNQAFKNNNLHRISKDGINLSILKQYLIYYITDKAFKNWHLMDLYAYNQRFGIFEEEFIFNRFINDNIDNINHFRKGGFIVRMMANVMGEYDFKHYLQGWNETDSSRFDSHEIDRNDSDGKFIEKVIRTWSYDRGFPIVSIERNYKVNVAVITQQYFSRDINKKQSSRYWVPLNFASEDNANFNDTVFTHWLNPKKKSMEVVTPPQDKWLICNKKQFGYYRVNYDEQNWKLIINYLKSKNDQKIDILTRAQLLDDAFVLAEFGYLNFNIPFDLTRYLKVETKYVPWETFWEKMFRLFQYSSISSSQYYEPFKNMILELSGPMERKLLSDEASDPNDRMERLNKISFIKWTCFYGSTFGCNYSLEKLKNWLNDPVNNPLLEDIRKEIMCSGIRTADKETWNKLLQKFFSSKDKKILSALMCSLNYELLDELIMMFINGQLIQQNPWYFLINVAQQSTIGLDAIIRFINNKTNVIHRMNNRHHLYPPTGFIDNFGEITYKMTNFRDFIDYFCTVIEQFITNHHQLQKFKQILDDNLDILEAKQAADHFYYAELKVRTATTVFNSMKAYWKANEEQF